MRAIEFRGQAKECLRLAHQTLDRVTREALTELASDFESQAERQKRKERHAGVHQDDSIPDCERDAYTKNHQHDCHRGSR